VPNRGTVLQQQQGQLTGLFGPSLPTSTITTGDNCISGGKKVTVIRHPPKEGTIISVRLVAEKKDIPAFVQNPSFGPIQGEASLNNPGPYNDPKKTGCAQYVWWVIWTGNNLNDFNFIREWSSSFSSLGRPALPHSGTGFLGPNAKLDIGQGDFDGPQPWELAGGNIPNSLLGSQYVIAADASGIIPNGGNKGFPVTLQANYVLYAQSRSTGKISGEINVTYSLNFPALGNVVTNSIT
jgi:hypothetical protein